ncbi:polyphosphate kinase 1 [Fibrella sp. HMF5335]|uniref:Polyphosphate kinase n=1 Tax=Fibrella rubiginis TaxID=2817060 RepID=A0A939GNS1_9BACT|nr:polyphosphate kinase 1 [Fibrella rubiginis]MBO0939843.1 polyphosphate kinase 1 [Fibrella rubiginis]
MTANQPTKPTYINRDLSWLSFNHRVLQEAANPHVPVYERVRFLAIFSSNLDEFFRVRMSSLLSLEGQRTAENDDAEPLFLPAIQAQVMQSQQEFGRLLVEEVLPELDRQGVHLYYGDPLRPEHAAAVSDYFFSRVLGLLRPIWLDEAPTKPLNVPDSALYLAVSLQGPGGQQRALVNIPDQHLPRFLALPPIAGHHFIAFLDDIIRPHLSALFPGYRVVSCHSVKITRNADVSIADEFVGQMDENIARMLDQRKEGHTTRFLYDPAIPADLLTTLQTAFGLLPQSLVLGGRYHNLSSLMNLPNPVGNDLNYPPQPPHPVAGLQGEKSIFDRLDGRDYLLHTPYQSYNPVLRFFNEAATHPDVTDIFVTFYRIAADSAIGQALLSAARNGKHVTVFMELKARFDEANNLRWSKQFKAAGIRLVYSIPNLKVHAKIAFVKRRINGQERRYGLFSTGNFNENTARFYTDHILLTSHPGLTTDLDQLVRYLQTRKQPAQYPPIAFDHLLVAQFNLLPQLLALIDREITHHQAGRPARITLKLNNLQDQTMVDKLYEASRAGVPIDLVVRGICTLLPNVPGQSETIRVRRIVDRYLEHGRVFVFHNNGQPDTYLGSADWMSRNLHRRVEVCFPVYDPTLSQQLRQLIDVQLADNTQATLLNEHADWEAVSNSQPPLRSQAAIYERLRQT